jgi:hypothetical protein
MVIKFNCLWKVGAEEAWFSFLQFHHFVHHVKWCTMKGKRDIIVQYSANNYICSLVYDNNWFHEGHCLLK